MKFLRIIKNGIVDENPTFVQVVGMCPLLAVSTTAINAVGMGLCASAVLICSNIFISMLRKFIPNEVRIPAFIVVIASFVTVIQLCLEAFMPELNESLGLFIPLIVVNCIILARAEAFASKNSIVDSIADGIGNGLGFTAAITALGIIREVIGGGTFFGMTVLPDFFPRTIMMILAPGAFITLALMMAFLNDKRNKKKAALAEKGGE